MSDIAVVSRVIDLLSHFTKDGDALGVGHNFTERFKRIKEDISKFKGLLLLHEDNAAFTMRLDVVIYEIADLLEELRRATVKPECVDQASIRKKVRSFITSCLSDTRESSPLEDMRKLAMTISMKGFLLTLIFLKEFMPYLPLRFKEPEIMRPQAENDQCFGRENDKKFLVELLLAETNKQVEVISIVGILGSGKTTFARSLFNDDRVKQHFDVQGWARVSNVFDETSIATQLLGSSAELSELEDYFSGKRVLLVFDDLWTDDVQKWEPFKKSLRNSAPGSKILVTTRSDGVEKAITAAHNIYSYNLGQLSDLDCWLLISKVIEQNGKPKIPKKMIKIGKKIAKGCKGSPQIAKIVGMELLHKYTPQEWEAVLDAGIWEMEEVGSSLHSKFYMTYKELSRESKLCFWYCAFFPSDHSINVDQLIRLWMAEGYFGLSTDEAGDKVMQRKAMECFNELAGHHIFKGLARDSIHKDKVTSCKIEGAPHEFIKSMVSSCFVDEKLRSFLSYSNSRVPYLSSGRMKHLRSLVLSSCHLEQFPSEAQYLSLLQYLDLSCNPLKELPEALCKLSCLQFIDVCFCYLLLHLPQGIGKVQSLKHLRVNCTADELHVLPQGFENLTLIRTLDVVRIGGKYGSNVKKLKELNHLEDIRIAVHGKVDILEAQLEKKAEMENLELCFVGDGRALEMAKCIDKLVPPPNLQMLKIEDYPGFRLPKWILAKSLINRLRRLSVGSGSNISSLPNLWKLSCLEFLWLYNIPSMKCLGREFFGFPKTMQQQPRKENKTTWSNPSKDDEDQESDDDSEDEEIGRVGTAFLSLKTLRIEYLQNWETWEDLDEADEKRVKEKPSFGELIAEVGDEGVKIKVLPSLEELIIADCPRLKALPRRVLGAISSLEMITVDGHYVNKDLSSNKPSSSRASKLKKLRMKPVKVKKQRYSKSQKPGAPKS